MNRPDLRMNFLVVARNIQAVVVVFGVVGLRRVDEEQSGSLEMSSVACSSEIKEDGPRFVERQRGDNSFKVAGFESNEQLCS